MMIESDIPVQMSPGWCTCSVKLRVPAAKSITSSTAWSQTLVPGAVHDEVYPASLGSAIL